MNTTEWSLSKWMSLDAVLKDKLRASRHDAKSREIITVHARRVMRHYTTGFFIVSRFLPKAKRNDVELIYAAVRYPDEVVDTFDIPNEQKYGLLQQWRDGYEKALSQPSLSGALKEDVPPFIASFSDLVKRHAIPEVYYRSFLDAMAFDIAPRPFKALDDLIEGYIYGSAIVVGYFLTHVYGASSATAFSDAMDSARNLGIGLQLTNFLRDVKDDANRGRLYLPQDMLLAHGIERFDPQDHEQQDALKEVVHELAGIANGYYDRSFESLDAFCPDSRIAIKACIDVYRMLNQRIADSGLGIDHRESVPMAEKLKPLPASKYWRIPMAYLTK
jgi:phytoene synthase